MKPWTLKQRCLGGECRTGETWEIVQAWQDLAHDDERVQEQLALSPYQLRLALAFYREFSEEIDSALALARRSLADLESAYPFAEVLRIGG